MTRGYDCALARIDRGLAIADETGEYFTVPYLYRLRGEDDLASIGFDDFMAPADGVTLVEWPERAATALPERYLLIEIETVGPGSRRLRLVSIPDDEISIRRIENLRSHIGGRISMVAPHSCRRTDLG